MATLLSARTPLVVPVSDRAHGQTVIKQKARVCGTGYTQDASGVFVAYIDLEVTMYAADAAASDGYGPPLTSPGFVPYAVRLLADNNAIVDAATGQILAIRTTETGPVWLGLFEQLGTERDVMLQGDYYETLRDTPIANDTHVLAHIRAADRLMKRFT